MKMKLVVKHLQSVRLETEKELSRINSALHALGAKKPSQSVGPRLLSKEARKRISEAQIARWAKVRKNGKAKAA